MQGLSQRVLEGFNGKHNSDKIVVLAGGGMDSFAVAMQWASTRNDHYTLYLLVIDYGQRTFEEEIRAVTNQAKYIYEKTGVDTQIIVEKINWNEDNNPQGNTGTTDYVPNRNLTFLVTAARVAEEYWAEEIGIGIIANHQAGDEIGFLDTTPQFLFSVEQALKWSSKKPPAIYAPFATVPKFIVLHHLFELMKTWDEPNGKEYISNIGRLPELTYSCYHTHPTGAQCGECSSCKGLKRAFLYADIDNPFIFMDELDKIHAEEMVKTFNSTKPMTTQEYNGPRRKKKGKK